MEVVQQISRIESKIHQLTDKVVQLQSENYTLRLENEELKTAASQHQKEVNMMAANLDKTRGALEKKRADDPESVQQLRKQLAEYIEELDQVITILHESK